MINPNRNKTNLLGLSRPQMEVFFTERGEKAFRATQIMKWIHHRGVANIRAMTNLSQALRSRLLVEAEIAAPQLMAEHQSRDGTRKWALMLDDGNIIETVFIPDAGRGTLCVSSQAGCALNCSFCATARQGFNRNLTSAEIVAQLWFADHLLRSEDGGDTRVSNVVLMGMGEPLLNFEHVTEAMRVMVDDNGYGLSKRKVTLSTAGLVPAIDRLRETVDVSLAVSLHAPDDRLRDQLVPLNRKYPIQDLLAACRRYVAGKERKLSVTFEYVLIKGVNDTREQAQSLVRLLRGMACKVNIIPFNPFPGTQFQRPDSAVTHEFSEIVQRGGIFTMIRKTRGEDIDAACGQLVGQVKDRRHQRLQTVRVEDHSQSEQRH
jgi:23S rRNA (adenine2503-C2)-methyltransferase